MIGRVLLSPLALLYGCAVWLRNRLFDAGWLPQESFSVPVICIGNLTAGGTGKTPHTEYIIRLLSRQFRVAVLSRGYRRASKGFVLASPETPVTQLGDEPYQMKQKFPQVTVAVDANRRRGIHRLLPLKPDVILLDDAFQHRYVRPTLSLLLTDYHRLMTRDCLLPAGRLREPLSGKKRAQVLVVTKCPPRLSSEECAAIRQELQPLPHQQVYFTSLVYGQLQQVFQPGCTEDLQAIRPTDTVLLITGIAQPQPLMERIRACTTQITHLDYPDHHTFTQTEQQRMEDTFHRLRANGGCWVVTTEKDATRLAHLCGWSQPFREALWALPIQVQVLEGKEQELNERICKELK